MKNRRGQEIMNYEEKKAALEQLVIDYNTHHARMGQIINADIDELLKDDMLHIDVCDCSDPENALAARTENKMWYIDEDNFLKHTY